MERAELSIAVERAADEVTYHLAGEIDVLTVTKLSTLVNEELAEPPARIDRRRRTISPGAGSCGSVRTRSA